MVLRKYDLKCIDGYESEEDIKIEDTSFNVNACFYIEGLIVELGVGFMTSRRGQGNTLDEAMDDAYMKVFNKTVEEAWLYN